MSVGIAHHGINRRPYRLLAPRAKYQRIGIAPNVTISSYSNEDL